MWFEPVDASIYFVNYFPKLLLKKIEHTVTAIGCCLLNHRFHNFISRYKYACEACIPNNSANIWTTTKACILILMKCTYSNRIKYTVMSRWQYYNRVLCLEHEQFFFFFACMSFYVHLSEHLFSGSGPYNLMTISKNF